MQIKDIAPSYGLASVILISIYPLKYMALSRWSILLIQLFLGFVLFFVLSKAMKLQEFKEVIGMLKPYLKFGNR